MMDKLVYTIFTEYYATVRNNEETWEKRTDHPVRLKSSIPHAQHFPSQVQTPEKFSHIHTEERKFKNVL